MITAVGIRTRELGDGVYSYADECVECGEIREIAHKGFCTECV